MRPDLNDFEGIWTFDRRVTHEAGLPAKASGHAVFTPDGTGLRYDETGQLRINDGSPMTATRCYLWRRGGVVLFEDGRAFHTIPDDEGPARHYCGADTYHVRYDFLNWPIWTSRWSVTGPKKAYDMATVYQPG
ncbi:MAG: DUF6314 family protein [Pseudomonadota bacterium]